MHELQAKIIETKAKIVAVVKIHPKNCRYLEIHPNNCRYQLSAKELNINNFQLFCTLDNGGRGVCVYVHQSLHAHICTNGYLSQNLTATNVKVSDTRSKLFIVGIIYRSPNSSLCYSQDLNKLIDNLHMYKKDIILGGDWNYPETNWKLKQSIMPPDHPSSTFQQSCSNASLAQLVKKTTRVKGVGVANLLHLILTNCEDAINQLTIQSPIGKNDHVTIILKINIARLNVEPKATKSLPTQ